MLEKTDMFTLQDIWNNVMSILSEKLTTTSIKTWFSDCTPVDLDNDLLVLHTPSELKRSVLNQRFESEIKDALQEMFSCDFNLLILAGDDELDEYRRKKGKKAKADASLPEMDGYTFEDFVVGKCNELAFKAAQRVVDHPGSTIFNPLFIYGGSGLGKTHLLFAICSAFREKAPKAKIVFVRGEEFTNQLVRSIKEGTTDEFRRKYREVDMLLMDDIQFIAGKEATQEEFFHTFEALYEDGKQIVIASDRPPIDMSRLNERLRTRFVGGMMADIQPPDEETRAAILRSKAGHRDVRLSDSQIEFIAQKVITNVRQLEGVINRLAAYLQLSNAAGVTQEMVERAVADVVHIIEYLPTPDDIISEVSRYYQVSPEQIKGPSKQKNITTARHITAYLMRTMTDAVETDIGRFLNRDHSTVHASITKVQDMIRADKKLADTIQDITSNINAHKH